jgi:glutathione synthase
VCAGRLQEIVEDAEQAEVLRKCFAGLWGLDNPDDAETKDIIAKAIEQPDKYILKPQREGGGNNLYGPNLLAPLPSLAFSVITVVLLNIEPRGSTFVRGKSKEVSIVLGSFPHRRNPKWFNCLCY